MNRDDTTRQERPLAALRGIDLNLWLVLGHLLETSSVSATAVRLRRTQSAVSHSLAQLRRIFDDRLFVRMGSGLQPTPRALSLAPQVHQALDLLAGSLVPEDFVPARLAGVFRVAMSDYAQAVLLPALLPRVRERAPGVIFDVTFRADDLAALALDVRDQRLDLALAIPGLDTPGLVTRHVLDEANVIVVRRGHPLAHKLTVERWAAADHVLASPRGGLRDFVDSLLEARGLSRRVVARVPHFLVALTMVMSSDLVTLAPARLARAFAAHAGLSVLTPPLAVPDFSLVAYSPEVLRDDAAHVWLREEVVAAARSLKR